MLSGQGCKVAVRKPRFFVSQPMIHLCLSVAFLKVDKWKGAFLLLHWHIEKHFPHHHYMSIVLAIY